MSIDVAWGTAERSSEVGAFDAALARAGLHNYNLVKFSSVVPRGVTVREVGTLSADWPVGERVGVVLARGVARNDRVVAGLGWALAEEGGILVEGSAPTVDACRHEVETGIAEAREIRDWNWEGESQFRVTECETEGAGVGAAVVVAAYGPIAGPTDP